MISGSDERPTARRRSIPASSGAAEFTSVELQGLRVVAASFPAGLSLPRHYHDRGCLTVVLGGAFSEQLLGRANECRRATVLAKPALEPHTDRFASDVGSHQVIVEPDGAWLDGHVPPGPLFREITNVRDSGAELIGRRLVEEISVRDTFAPLAIEGLVLELLARAARESTGSRERPLAAWLRRARDLVLADTAESRSVAGIASAVGVHPVYLARMFRLHFGTSVAGYVRKARLDRAAVLVATSDMPIATIALQTGFFDQSHFTRWFKRHTGLTPLAYRRAVRRTRDQ
ncbi:MAG: helix-turn-helix transcriptional regulator [Gemmatimonadaceae bacterium]